MKKEMKKYWIVATLHRLSDYDDPSDQIIESRGYYRWGVSEKQIVSRLKHTEGLECANNRCGSVFYEWRFELTEIDPNTNKPKNGYEQINIFDMEDLDD